MMKNIFKYIGLIALGFVSLTACQDDFDDPQNVAPVTTLTANTTIAELKATYWNDNRNYIDTIEPLEDGTHRVISGRVISSDASGNIYKSLVIQDATAALAMSINANSLYTDYRVGQEIVIDVTDMYIGKYNGLQQLGFPNFTEQYGWEATFMPKMFFVEHAQLNGMPEPDAVKVLQLTGADLQSGDASNLQRLQSQLVRFNDCHFELGGQTTFTDGSKETSNRNLILADGTSIIVRTSGYSNFWGTTLPEGQGDVQGILSYYGTDWQMMLIDVNGCMNFGNPTKNPGSAEIPYTVGQAIDVISAGVTANDVWSTGFIVGAVAPGVSSINSNSDIEFSANVSLDNTLVIAATPDEKDFTKCLVFALPQGSALRKYGNLLDHPENYGKVIKLKGNLGKYLDSYGITGNTGNTDAFEIEGVEIVEVSGTIFSETFATSQGGFTIDTATSPGFDVWKYDSKYQYMIATAYESATKVNHAADSWLISPVISLKGAETAFLSFEQALNFFSNISTATTEVSVAVRVAGTTNWTTLTVPTWPSSMSWDFVASGDIDLAAFTGKEIQIGFHYTSTSTKAGTWELKNILVSTEGNATGGGGDTPGTGTDPVTPGTGSEFVFGSSVFSTFTLPGSNSAQGFTFDIQKSSGTTAPTFHSGTSAVRLYADNTMSISGKKMNKIILTLSSDAKARYTTFTPSTGSITPAQAAGDTQIVWEGNASDVTFTVGHDAVLGTDGAGARGQIRFTSITIYAE